MDLSMGTIILMAIPAIASLLMLAFPSKITALWVYESIHILSVIAVCCLAVYLVLSVVTKGADIFALGNWFHLDALSAVFVCLIGVIGLLAGWYSITYIRHDIKEGHMTLGMVKQYYIFFNLFIFTMLVVALSNNIIMMWVAVEATTLATVFLVGAYNTRSSLMAAWKYIIVCTVGVAFGLYGTLIVYANAAAVMVDPHAAVFWTSVMPYATQFDAMLIQVAFVFVVIGFGTKAGLFPMHTWLPDAHSEAPSPISALLSGVLIKCAMLIVIRFYILATEAVGSRFPQMIMLIIGILSVVVAAFSVFRQKDVKRMLAYSSVENIGIVALCLGFGGPLGIAAALIHIVVHGFSKALLFCLSGNILIKYGTRDLTKITGVLRAAPITAVLLFMGLFAVSGFPPFAMFISELLAVVAGVVSHNIWAVIILGLALTIVIAAFIRVIAKSVFGTPAEGVKKGDLGFFSLLPQVLMVAVILWFGIAMPQPFLKGIDSATAIVLQKEGSVLYDTPVFNKLLDLAPQADQPSKE